MAITGTFAADFSSFTTAVDAADVKLKGFEDDSKKVETSLTRMGNALSGTKMIQDATLMAKAVEDLGGVSKLTETELQRLGTQAKEAISKMQAMGIDVPDRLQSVATAATDAAKGTSMFSGAISTATGVLGAFGIQATVEGFINLSKAIIADASALENLSARTAISTDTLQRFKVAGDETGVSLDAMANGMNKLQKNLAEGSGSTVSALSDLHLQLSDIRHLAPEEQFYAVADALKQVKDPAEQVAIATQLFGKGGTELLPVVKRGFDDVKDSSVGMSKETIKALDDAGNAATRFYNNIKTHLGEDLADILTNTTREFRDFQSSLDAVFKIAEKNAPDFAKAMGAIVPPGLPADLEKIIQESNAWAAAQKVVAEGMAELTGLGKGFQETINGIDGTIVEAVKWYLEAGASQSALAKTFDLTAAQVGAIDRSMKAYTETLKAVMAVEKQHVEAAEQGALGLSKIEQETSQKSFEAMAKASQQITDAATKLHDEKMRLALDSASYEIAKLYEVADANVAAMQKSGATSQQIAEYTKLVYQAADLAASQVEYKADAVLEHVTEKAVQAAKTIQDVMAVANAQADANLPIDLTGNAAAVAAKLGGTAAGAGGVTYVTGSGVGGGSYKPLSQLPNYSQSQMPVIGGARATGGPVTGGTPYLVGERGPELYVPTESGTIVPNNVITQFKNTFHLTDTQDGLARKIAAVLMRSLTSAQQLPLR